MNNYYDVSIKNENLDLLQRIVDAGPKGNDGKPVGSYSFIKTDICEKELIHKIFKAEEDKGMLINALDAFNAFLMPSSF